MAVSAEDQVLAGIEHGHLGQALAGLSPELRWAIEATVLDGLSCAEAAVLLGVAEGTVKSRCHRARVALRAALAGQQAGTEARHTTEKRGGHHDEPLSRRGRAGGRSRLASGRGPPGYVCRRDGREVTAWSVEAHLTGCARCRSAVSAHADQSGWRATGPCCWPGRRSVTGGERGAGCAVAASPTICSACSGDPVAAPVVVAVCRRRCWP